jgi:hypothetical protein
MLEIKAHRQVWRPGIELLVIERDAHGGVSIAQPMTLERAADGLVGVTQPTAVLTQNAAQMLMDELWQCGLRPTEGSGSAGSLAATERHLDDMRAIAKGLLRNTGVEV